MNGKDNYWLVERMIDLEWPASRFGQPTMDKDIAIKIPRAAIAHAQPGEAMDLGKGPDHDEVGERLAQATPCG